MTRQLSQHAQVAKRLRQYCKGLGIECRARSRSFSMGDAVDVDIYDQPPAICDQVKAEADKYAAGDFNGMEDIYEYRRTDDGLPKSKYVHVNNHFSADIKQAAWDVVRAHFAGGEDAPERLDEAGMHAVRIHDQYVTDLVYQFLTGAIYGDHIERLHREFWAERAPAPPEAVTVDGVTIEEHTHTKRGFQMFIVILPHRVERAEFDALRARAKAAGGWYSRKWGKTPAGFAFKERDQAEAFAADLHAVA